MSRTVVVTDVRSRLAIRNGQLSLIQAGAEVKRFKAEEVDQVILFGNVDISAAAISYILRHGIDCVFMTRNGRYKGRLTGMMSKNIELRVKQFEAMRDEGFAVRLARGIVAGKVLNQRYVLMRAQRRDRGRKLEVAIRRLRSIGQQVKREESIDTVRGYEAEAAAIYFRHFGQCISNPLFTFVKRTRRPPKDPVNAALSFGYALLQAVVEGLISEVGLDPYLGALHTVQYGRTSLVFDMMEEFRPIVVDMVVLRLINRRQLSPGDFGPPKIEEEFDFALDDEEERELRKDLEGAVYLQDRGRRVLIQVFLSRLREVMFYPRLSRVLPMKEIIRQQIYRLARVIKGEEDEYVAFTLH